MRYHVLEAQPEVVAAMRKGGRTARTVRRSILLTPFGEDFCETCLPLETEEEGDVLAGDRVPPAPAEPVGEAQSQERVKLGDAGPPGSVARRLVPRARRSGRSHRA